MIHLEWHDYFMGIMDVVATKSKDRSTKVGCVIVDAEHGIVATGYNGFPRGVDDDINVRHERPAKYVWTEHADHNAIFDAARQGKRTAGGTMYLPWHPCSQCTRAIIQAGIVHVVHRAMPAGELADRWAPDFEISGQMLAEAGVTTLVHQMWDPDSILEILERIVD